VSCCVSLRGWGWQRPKGGGSERSERFVPSPGMPLLRDPAPSSSGASAVLPRPSVGTRGGACLCCPFPGEDFAVTGLRGQVRRAVCRLWVCGQ